MLSAAAHTDHRRRLLRYLPQVLLATMVLTVGPLLVVWTARASGLIVSMLPLILLGIVVSLALSAAGSAYWKTRSGSGDLLFGELMLWGWLWRWRTERRLESAIELLGLTGKAQRARIGDLGPARQVQLLEDLAAALESRDTYTHGHSQRVARHASVIAERMGLSRGQVARIRAAAAIHDVGKIETPNQILNKKGQLTDDEFEVIQRHPFLGARMVYPLGDEELAWMVLYHHERLDGGGYPLGLSGDDIPLGARIIAVADTFDALTSTRPYRTARSHRLALRILAREAGTRLDPAVVRAFTSHYSARRSVAAWALLSSLPQRLLFPFVGEINAVGGAGSAAKVIAATAAAAAVGSAAVGQPIASPLQHQSVADLPAAERADSGFPDLRQSTDAQSAAAGAEQHEVAGLPVSEQSTASGDGAGSLQLSVRGAEATTGSESVAAIGDAPVSIVPADPDGSAVGEAPAGAAPTDPPLDGGTGEVSIAPADPGTVPGSGSGVGSGVLVETPPAADGGGGGQAKPTDVGGGVLGEIVPPDPGATTGSGNDPTVADTPGNGNGNANGQGNGNGGGNGNTIDPILSEIVPPDPGATTAGGNDPTVADGGIGAVIPDPAAPGASGDPATTPTDVPSSSDTSGNGNGNANGQGNGNGNGGVGNGNGNGNAAHDSGIETILTEITPDGPVADILTEIVPGSPASGLEAPVPSGTIDSTVLPVSGGGVAPDLSAPAASDGSSVTDVPPPVASTDSAPAPLESIAGVVLGIIAGSPESGAGSFVVTSPSVDPGADPALGTDPVDPNAVAVPGDVPPVADPASAAG